MPTQPANSVDETPEGRARNGAIAGLAAFSMWGFLPIYFKLAHEAGAVEMLVHRIVWAVPFGALIIFARRQWPEVWRAIRHRQTLGLLALAALFIAINWIVYIWAVQQSQIFQASLGYYINPLMYVLIGVLLFGERLRSFQLAAVVLATVGVVVLTISGGVFPFVSITVAVSFTIYGVIRKRTDVGGMPGLFIETLILTPLALGVLLYLVQSGQAAFRSGGPQLDLFLMLAGPVTVMPLLCFALAARRLTLSTLGFMQFIAPTLQFVVGLGYGERLTPARAVCFSCIWLAVLLFCWDAWQSNRARVPVASAG